MSRDPLADVIARCLELHIVHQGGMVQKMKHADIERIAAMLRAVPSETSFRWIPVSERIPERHVYPQSWLVFDGERIRLETNHPSWWNKKDERGKEYDGPTVTHWMPMPEAPK